MNIQNVSIESATTAAASQMQVLAAMARRLRAIPEGDPRRQAARHLLAEMTKQEKARSERLLSMEFAAMAA